MFEFSFRPALQRFAAIGLAVIAMVATVLVVAPPANAQSGDVTISILHNNDGESKLLADADSEFPGIARFVQALKDKQAASTADGVITLTSGDNFLASKEFNASIDKGAPYYDSIALSGLYDVMALGNHDFDFGPDVAADFISGFDPAIPFLSANADVSNEPVLQALADDGLVAPSAIIDVAGTKVGVIGAVTPQLPNISSPRNVVIDSAVAAVVNAEAAALEAAGVNKIILISHLQGIDEDQALIPQLSGIDVAIAGGGDELLANDGDTCTTGDVAGPYPLVLQDADGNDVPVVTGPGGYRCIGQLDVTFNADGEVTATAGGAMAVALDGAQDADVLANVEEPVAAAVADLESNVLGSLKVDLDGQRGSVRTMSSNEGSLLADALLDAGQRLAADFGAAVPVVGLQNGGGIRNDAVIPAGDFTEADTFDIAPFSNFVVVVEVPRDRFKQMLEEAYNRLPDAGGAFAQPAGFIVDVNLANPAREINRDGECELTGDPGSRIQNVTLFDGTKIVENGEVIDGPAIPMATIDFLAGGGDCYPLGDLDATKLGTSYQQALADYVSGTLDGNVSPDMYPENGTGRVIVNTIYSSQPNPQPTAAPVPTAAPAPTTAPAPIATAAPAPAPIATAAPAPVAVHQPAPIIVSNSAYTQAQIDAMFAGGSVGAAASTADDKKVDDADDKKKATALAHTGSGAAMPAMFGLALLGAGSIFLGIRRRSTFAD